MNKHNREVTVEILVGLFMFTVLIALSIFTIVLSRDSFLKTSHAYEFVFSEVNGLREGDNVFLRGMNIGRVNQTQLEDNRVHVYVTLDVPITLRRGYSIEVVAASMLGGKSLKIYEGPENAPEIGDQVDIIGSQPVDILAEFGNAVRGFQVVIDSVSTGKGTLGKMINDGALYDNLLVLSEDLKIIGNRLEQGEGTIGKLLKDDAIYTDAQVVMANLRGISDGLEKGEGSIGKLLKDDTVYTDAQVLVANLREISDRLAAGQGTLGKLLSEDDKLYQDLGASMASIRSITETIDSGEGTIGRLVRDAKLYDEATLLVEDIRAAVDDLREASPITSFGSVVFGAF